MPSKTLEQLYVGVDTSTRSICLGTIGKTECEWEWFWEGLSGTIFEKIEQAYQVTYDWVLKNSDKELVIAIEEPVYINNGTTHMVLCLMYGAVVKAFLDWGIVPTPVNITSWKKAVVGKGNSNKDTVRAYMVNRLGLSGDLEQDVYDALAVSLFIRR